MARPAVTVFLPGLVFVAIAACAAPAAVGPPPRAAADLPLPTRSVDGLTVATAGDHRAAVGRLVDAWLAALERRDVAGLRALIAPTIGRLQQSGPGLSREAWLAQSEAIFTTAARAEPWLRGTMALESYAQCAPGCASLLLAPGEWQVRWLGGWSVRVRPGMPSDQVLPVALRVTVTDGVAAVVGFNDEVVSALGPAAARVSGWPQP